jgi:hypothetical protein
MASALGAERPDSAATPSVEETSAIPR